MPGRTIAIGDIHGNLLALKAVVDAIDPGPEDRLVPLGDYINQGPDSRGVLDLMLALSTRCVLIPLLGNHEEMLIAATRSTSAMKEWLYCGGKQMLASYGVSGGTDYQHRSLESIIPEEHWQFIVNCLPFYETETHVFAHANYLPDLPMEQQPIEALRWQFVNPKTARPHCSGKVVIVGHAAQRSGEILDLGFLKCIDTGCEQGKWLTGLDVSTGQVWQANKRGELRPA